MITQILQAISNTTQTQMPQNLVTSIYQTHLCNTPTYVTLTWSKSFFSHSLTIHASHSFSLTISLLPYTFPLFKTRPSSKSVHSAQNHKLKIHWDFSQAKFARPDSADPGSAFYIAIVYNSKLEFFIGDKRAELTRRAGLAWVPDLAESGTLLSRREHVFGNMNYVTRAEVMGFKHDISIECKSGVLIVKVDGEISLVVKRLAWKFRGSERIKLGGLEVVFFWDVFNWVDKNHKNVGKGKSGVGHGVFGFQIGDCGKVLPEMVGAEKKLIRKCFSSKFGNTTALDTAVSPTQSCSSVMQWAEESSSECGRSSCSSSTRSCGSGRGFSFLLYAWTKY